MIFLLLKYQHDLTKSNDIYCEYLNIELGMNTCFHTCAIKHKSQSHSSVKLSKLEKNNVLIELSWSNRCLRVVKSLEFYKLSLDDKHYYANFVMKKIIQTKNSLV